MSELSLSKLMKTDIESHESSQKMIWRKSWKRVAVKEEKL